ncbi:MAG: hypothetical protein J1G06_09240 [Oscillospiraceae bacterium]|nr:hypothetical protein [Oscillospiraceae bacterium]
MRTTIIVACVAAVVIPSLLTAVAIISGRKERKDLYDRIMCGNMKEYKTFSEGVPKMPKSRHGEIINKWRDPNPQ